MGKVAVSFLLILVLLPVRAGTEELVSLDTSLNFEARTWESGPTFSSAWMAAERRVVYVLKRGQRKVSTGITFIVPESDSVFVNGLALTRGKDYRLNYLRGTLILTIPVKGGERLELKFARYPFRFPPLFAVHLPSDSITGYTAVVPSKARIRKQGRESLQYSLNLSGSKSVGVSVGTGKGLGLDQSLQISMAGKISKDIKVSAYLTDDNLPVQPEGNTEEIKQLDKVFVKVESSNAQLVFGDLTTGVSWANFSSFKRDLRGVSGSFGGENWQVFAGGGITKGRFKTVRIVGQEGVQGPYELLPARRFNGVIILPASESVYLDGKLLKRGRENDYVIDYAFGTVTFTERVMITSDSEIVVDFQISEDEYRRTSIFGGWVSPEYFGSLKFRTYILQEGDDAQRPLRGEITEEERAIIESSGDDESRAISSGIREVETGLGNYVLVDSDTLPSHFEYVEEGGNYILSFIEVGNGKGDYVTDGFSSRGQVRYKYVGMGNGDFIIGRRLPLPERNRLAALQASVNRGVFTLDIEGDVSSYDRNILSGMDDDDNLGTACIASGGIGDIRFKGLSLSLLGNYSFINDRFKSPGRERKQYFYRNWALDDVPLSGDESIGGGKLLVRYRDLMSLSVGYNELKRTSGIDASKKDISFSLGDTRRRGLKVTAFESETSQDRTRRFVRGEGTFSFWKLQPMYSYEEERYSSFYPALPDTGRFYIEHMLKLRSIDTRHINASLFLKRRSTSLVDDVLDVWFHARRSDEIGFQGNYSKSGTMVDFILTHRMNDELRTGSRSWYDLAKLRYRDKWERFNITTDINYRISSGEERTRERAVVYVGENQGDYDSEGREVGQKRGDYMLLYLPGRYSEKVHSVFLDLRMSFGTGIRGIGVGGKETLAGRIARYISCDNFFSVEEKSKSDDLLELYLLKPSLLQRNDLTIYGITRLRQEWHFLRGMKKINFSLVISREDEEDNRSEANPIDRYAKDVSFRMFFAPRARLSLQWELGESRKKREAALNSEQVYNVRALSASQKLNYRLGRGTRLSFQLSFESRKDEVSMADQRSYSAAPSVNSSIGKKFNLLVLLRITYTDSRETEGKPLFFLENGLREEWSLTAHYRFTRNLSLGVNYFGRREKDYTQEVKTIHDLKIESRAYF